MRRRRTGLRSLWSGSRSSPERVQDKLRVRVEELESLGHELRRPKADILRDGIYELRVEWQKVQYRLLYFFHGKNVAIINHGCTKTAKVPPEEIDRVVQRRDKFIRDPDAHTWHPT